MAKVSKVVKERLFWVHSEYLTGDIQEIVDALLALKSEYRGKGFTNLSIEERGDHWDTWPEFHLYGDRPKTEKELERDKKKAAQKRAQRERTKQKKLEAEKKQYERLKKRFDPQNSY